MNTMKYSKGKTLHEYFEDHVFRTPHKKAVVSLS
jgi:hypothetical protein